MRARVQLALPALLAFSTVAGAQRAVPVARFPEGASRALASPMDFVPPLPGSPTLPFGIPVRDSAWWVPLASTAVPGYGQLLLGQNRFVAYMAAEGFFLLNHLNSQAESGRERDRFRQLARNVAQGLFTESTAIGSWDNYEAMEKFAESGVFDRTPFTGEFSPEVDLATFNGEQWRKARDLAGWDPNVEPPRDSRQYRDAISYYLTHAVGPEFRWSWRNAQLEWDLYRRSITRYNDASREARQWLAVLAVNHLLSTVDAFVTLRLRGGVGASGASYTLTGRAGVPRFPLRRSR